MGCGLGPLSAGGGVGATIEGVESFGKILVAAGLIAAVIGALLWAGWRPPRLPGDIVIQRPGFTLYAPVGGMIVLSLVGSLILWLASRGRA